MSGTVLLGGTSRSYLSQIPRATALALQNIGSASHCSPQVKVCDNASDPTWDSEAQLFWKHAGPPEYAGSIFTYSLVSLGCQGAAPTSGIII